MQNGIVEKMLKRHWLLLNTRRHKELQQIEWTKYARELRKDRTYLRTLVWKVGNLLRCSSLDPSLLLIISFLPGPIKLWWMGQKRIVNNLVVLSPVYSFFNPVPNFLFLMRPVIFSFLGIPKFSEWIEGFRSRKCELYRTIVVLHKIKQREIRLLPYWCTITCNK